MEIQAKKSLGQNFLKNKGVLEKITETGDLSSKDIVLETGPGEGALTEKLLEKGCKVIAVEKDHCLIDLLKEKFENEIKKGQLILIEGDILEFSPTENGLKPDEYKIIANIPYYITGSFLRKFLEENTAPSKIVLMVQKEIADRIVAKDSKESILSMSVKAYGEPKIIMKVSKGSFKPMPKVDSAILLIENISKNFFISFGDLTSKWEEKFFEILKAGFAHKRKILISNLKNCFEKNGKDLSEVFVNLNLSKKIRAEDLKLEDWKKLLLSLKN